MLLAVDTSTSWIGLALYDDELGAVDQYLAARFRHNLDGIFITRG